MQAKPDPRDPSLDISKIPIDEMKQTCPCSPISGIDVISMTFLSDHHVLKNQESDWTNSGVLYPKPDWQKGRNQQSPVSHSMNKRVKLKVVLKVKPENACPQIGTLECTGPEKLSIKAEKIEYKAGEIEVNLGFDLPKKVQKINFNLSWKAKTPTGTFITRTRNELFVDT